MFTVKMNNPNEGTWFTLDSGAQVCLRVCTTAVLRQIRKATVTKHRQFQDGAVYVWEETNEDLVSEMTFDYCIVDWSGIVDECGNPIPCTPETKVFLMNNSNTFAKQVIKSVENLNAAEDTEAETKN